MIFTLLNCYFACIYWIQLTNSVKSFMEEIMICILFETNQGLNSTGQIQFFCSGFVIRFFPTLSLATSLICTNLFLSLKFGWLFMSNQSSLLSTRRWSCAVCKWSKWPTPLCFGDYSQKSFFTALCKNWQKKDK